MFCTNETPVFYYFTVGQRGFIEATFSSVTQKKSMPRFSWVFFEMLILSVLVRPEARLTH